MNYYNYNFKIIENYKNIYVFDLNNWSDLFKYFLINFLNDHPFVNRYSDCINRLRNLVGKARTDLIMTYVRLEYGSLFKMINYYTFADIDDICNEYHYFLDRCKYVNQMKKK